MAKITKEKRAAARGDYWRERIAEQERSGMTVQGFCEDRGLTEQSFYVWRKRLRKQQPMRFALLETRPARPQATTELSLELVLTTGERLRIGAGVDPTALRRVLEALRA
jgi:transposase-like protein